MRMQKLITCEKLAGICFLLFLPLFSFAQPASRNADSVYVFGLLDRAEVFFTDAAYDSALYYCNKAEIFSKTRNFKKGLAYTLIEKTDIYMDMDDLDKAGLYPSQINTIGIQLKDSIITAVSWMQMAQVKMYNNEFDEAYELFSKSLQYYLEKHPSRYSALAFNDLGYTWGRKGELSKQANCLMQSISIYENYFPDKYGEIGVAYNNLSTVYYTLNDMSKAIEYAKKSLVYREKVGDVARLSVGCCNLSQFYNNINTSEAERYLQLCVQYATQSKQESRMVHSYVTAANFYNARDKLSEALEYELKVINLLEKSKKDPAMLARRYMAAGTLSGHLNPDSAVTISYFKKSLAVLQSINDRVNLKDYYLQLSNYYIGNKRYAEAYDNYRKHIMYRDSILSDNTRTSIAEIATRYETEKKDNEISRLNTAQRIRELQIGKQNALIAGNLLEGQKRENEIELLSKAKELQELRIKQQDEQLEKQMLLARNNEQQLLLKEAEKKLQQKQLRNSHLVRNMILAAGGLLALLGYFLFNRYQLRRKIQEQEALLAVRNNIAKDLHDEIGSTLTSIKILSEVSGRNLHRDHSKTSSFLQKITEQSAAVQQGISDIVWSVKPENDKLENMVIRMREYVAQTLESRNICTVINIDEKVLDRTLDMNQRRDFFLIFKESVNNIAKYADATEVQIKLEKRNNDLQMHVIDNGKGFDVSRETSSSGLKNMRSRAVSLKGTMDIHSGQGKGSTIILTIPAT
jgi:two-component system sensor histidine kinase UhpB